MCMYVCVHRLKPFVLKNKGVAAVRLIKKKQMLRPYFFFLKKKQLQQQHLQI